MFSLLLIGVGFEQRQFWRRLLILLVAIFVFSCLLSCSALTGKSSFDAFVDGDPYMKNHNKPKMKVETKPSESSDKEDLYGFGSLGDNNSNTDADENVADDILLDEDALFSEQAPAVDEVSEIVLEEKEARCLAENNPSFSYRKRIAVLPMELQSRQHAVDIPYVEREYPQVLTERLNDAGLLARDATAYHRIHVHSQPSRLHSPFTSDQIRDTASRLNAQFLVTGRLVDLSFGKSKTHAIDLVTGLKPWKTLARQTYEGATGSYRRQLNIDVSVYDGPSGALIKRKRYRGEANHPVAAQRGYGLESNIFWQSDYGELMADVLDQQSEMISRALECLPMRAQISRVDEDVIEINAGIDSLLMPGDRLRIFHREPAGRDPMGVPKHRWKYYGGVTIMGVFPLKSIAVLDEDLAPDVIKLGDIVQAW